MSVLDSRGHMCLRSPGMEKMDPTCIAADMDVAVWNGYAGSSVAGHRYEKVRFGIRHPSGNSYINLRHFFHE
jgi:hypothetical protein